ncbi:type 1 glutamine amidotransferase [Anaeromyxobacter paludicola]|uniref:GMP synthase n=1 Tax=Anaeromyxobacter paludicola TaxID=2918171 RepID=A0ABN6NE50_9BACT|nr:type 1 glutamine amidotransferase [Anaeromyxobacter paludicola]BDG10877.1 GMP synthase [Anaeromyxobacter paludicola]
MKRVVIAQTGSVGPDVSDLFGDFPDWFARLLRGRAEPLVARAPGDLASLEPFDGVVVTGSFASVTAPEPWMDALSAELLRIARERPVLGVCFGHQLLARALGGRVERNPRGLEAGACEVALTPAGRDDPLFDGVPDRFLAHELHEDHVAELPPGAVRLAGNAMSPVQAFRAGNLRAVQFHPEIDLARARFFATRDRQDHDRRVPGGSEAVRASLAETPAAVRCFHNWLARYVGAAEPQAGDVRCASSTR